MGKRIWLIGILLLWVVNSEAQVTSGTVNSRTDDGVGNKITSTIVGPSRALDVNVVQTVGGGGGGTSSTFGAAFPATGTAMGLSDGTPNMRPGFAVDADTGAGTQYAQGVNLVFRSVGGPIEAGILANPLRTDPTGTTIQPVNGTVAVSNAFLLDATFTSRINTLGQKAMAASTPVVLASDQASIPVAATVSNAFLLDATFTGRFAAAYVDADTIANQTTTAMHGQLYGYNGATWDRLRSTIANGLAVDVTRVTGNVTVIQGTGTNLHVVCDSGCTPGGSFADSSAFTFATTAINNMGAVVDDTATNTVAENSAGAPRMNTNRILYSMPTNLTGTALYPTAVVEADGIANPTLTQISTFIHGWNGATWDRLKSTTANGLVVDVSRVQGSVAVTNAGLTNIDVALSTRLAEATFTGRFVAATLDADAIANETTTSVHGKCYLYNGASWDRCRGSVANGLTVSVSNATLAVTQSTSPWVENVSQFGGNNVVTGTGVSGVGIPRVTVSNDSNILATQSGTWNIGTLTSITNTVTVQGAKSNNAVVPGATNVGVLPCVATTAAPSYTDTFQVGCSTNLSGGARTDITQIVGAAPSVTNTLPVRESNGTSFFSSDTIGANIYKKVSTVQDIEVSSSNSSTSNLAPSTQFIGTSNTTLGVGAIQVNLFSDQNMSISVQQAQEDPGTNWNIVDTWTYQANSNGNDAARTIQATGSSVRVVITHIGDATTTVFRLQTVVCPICDTLPRGLTQSGNLKAAIVEPAPVLNTVPVFIIANNTPQLAPLQPNANKLTTAAQNAGYCRRVLCPPVTGGLR